MKTKTMSYWVNKLNFQQRDMIVQLYSGGISISAITKIYQVHHSSVRYHLKKAGVYVNSKKPELDMHQIEAKNSGASLDFRNDKGGKIEVIPVKKVFKLCYNESERNFPKSYKEYLERYKKRHESSAR